MACAAGPARFRPPLWAALAAVAACVAGIALGNWQWQRAEAKRAAAAAQKRVALAGTFLPEHTVFLANRLHRGRPGFHVVQPLRTAAGEHVLVNRGWVAAGTPAGAPPPVVTPAGAVRIEGVALERFPRALQAAGGREGRVWQNVERDEFAAWSGLALAPYVVLQDSPLDDGLVRAWPAPDEGADKNRAYALQWYALAALAVVLFFALGFRRDAPPSG
ncbi:MAG: SURF1 family protein [Burkholderiales bacterium]|nr:SURF1 family protein [Burkholderiales bacterium]